jgi:hypothetical protein
VCLPTYLPGYACTCEAHAREYVFVWINTEFCFSAYKKKWLLIISFNTNSPQKWFEGRMSYFKTNPVISVLSNSIEIFHRIRLRFDKTSTVELFAASSKAPIFGSIPDDKCFLSIQKPVVTCDCLKLSVAKIACTTKSALFTANWYYF